MYMLGNVVHGHSFVCYVSGVIDLWEEWQDQNIYLVALTPMTLSILLHLFDHIRPCKAVVQPPVHVHKHQ